MSPLSRFLVIFSLALAASVAYADPPARVGRLALVENSVTFRLDRDDQGGPASINWPISSGAMLESGRRGRSEVWIGSSAFRLGPDSQLEFPLVDDRQVLLRLSSGSLAVSIFDREQSDDVTVETPEGRIRFATPGRYRIDVLSDHTELTAQAGQASFSDEQRSIPVMAGQKATLYGGGQVRVDPDFDQDNFDRWVTERENAALASNSRRYVSPAMTGYQDLDNYGDWNSSSEYGAVWYPRSVADDWAPYRFGRWVWVAPWGWTWVDQSPWGFAPFHYGRWVMVRNRWGWVPGAYVARPVYAPALVAWIGNPGWSVGFRAGAAPAVGWFPLAPREVYVPGFQASAQFVHRVNGGHVRNMAEIDRAIQSGPRQDYAHRTQPQAVTIVPASQLSSGRPIHAGDFARQDRRELERAPARPTPGGAIVPPDNGRQFRDTRRDVDGAMPRAMTPAGRPMPAASELQQPGAAVPPMPNRDESRRGGFARDVAPATPVMPSGQAMPLPGQRGAELAPPVAPTMRPPANDGKDERRPPAFRESPPRQPASREASPARVPEMPPAVVRELEAIRRPVETMAIPQGERPSAWRQGNDGRDDRRAPAVREIPAPAPVVREMPAQDREIQRQQREMQRQADMQRPREMPQPVPQIAPQQQMRAPMPQSAPAPMPAPVREMPRPEVRPQPQPQAQPAPQQQRGGERRRDPGDERGGGR